jgi:cold shock CspA family protein
LALVGAGADVVAAVKGTVKFWRSESGWGFLQPDDATMDVVFVHHSKLPPGTKHLLVGDPVEYEIADSDRRPGSKMAVNIKVLE